MNTPIRQRATAFSLAALFTLSILGSINLLAMQPTPDHQLMAASAPVQVIVVEGKRLARG